MNFYTIAQEIGIAVAGIIIALITCKQYLNKYFKKNWRGKITTKTE